MSKSLFYHGEVSNSAGVVIPASTSTRAIDAVTVVNTSGASATITLWQVPAAGSRANANMMMPPVSVVAGQAVTLPALINHAIAQNATIHAQASAATSLTLIISGRSQ